MLLIWPGVNLLLDELQRRHDAELTKGVTAGPADAGATASAGEAAALLNAGLQFPLAAEMGADAVAGIGGTRLCDWWFTDDAVLIDASGRYTTQDSNAQVDRAGWETFLDLLKRTRPRQPLNGVLVAISLSDIARAPEQERVAHARAIRQRVRELESRLAVRMPVYLLLTKVDLIAGFTEFFAEFDRDKRAQVWGATFPLDTGDAGPAGQFATEFRALVRTRAQRLSGLSKGHRKAALTASSSGPRASSVHGAESAQATRPDQCVERPADRQAGHRRALRRSQHGDAAAAVARSSRFAPAAG